PGLFCLLANLASTYRNQGRWDEAERLFVEVMETRKAKLGADHPDTLTGMNNLAFTWYETGRHAEAISVIKLCVESRIRMLGSEHPHTASSADALSRWEASFGVEGLTVAD
ncbi:hypothetical protein BJ170DRAFT_589093, partial [Xylariales sp. AK1849]